MLEHSSTTAKSMYERDTPGIDTRGWIGQRAGLHPSGIEAAGS